MKVESDFIITLTRNEAVALKLVLGKQSDSSYTDLGLTTEEANKLSELYNLLPYPEEEQ